MNLSSGLFITFEGIDGCGKTTQARLVVDYLKGLGVGVTLTREPGGTAIGGKVRAILLDPANVGIIGLTELLLYSADRAQHVSEVIEPAIKAGHVVICDRFTDATEAYQGHARGLDLGVIEKLNAVATRGIRPDLTLLFDLPVEQALPRARLRNNDGGGHEARFEDEEAAFHEKVRQGYRAIAAKEPARVKVIDATGTVEEIQIKVRAIIEDFRTRKTA